MSRSGSRAYQAPQRAPVSASASLHPSAKQTRNDSRSPSTDLYEAKVNIKNFCQLTVLGHRSHFEISRRQADCPGSHTGGQACVTTVGISAGEGQAPSEVSPPSLSSLTLADANAFPATFQGIVELSKFSKWPLAEGALARSHLF